jgi:1-acyl-sn-glycerol-3-phosphate acyltransferase
MPVHPANKSFRDPAAGASTLFLNRNFMLLLAAYGVSALGDHLSEMGLLKLQHALDESVTDVTRRQAVMLFVFMLPFFVLGPFCGWLADRLPRKWIMIVADLIRAILIIEILPVLLLLHRWSDAAATEDTPLPLYIAVAPLFVIGIFAATFSPARLALLPTLIRPDQIIRANATTAGLGMLATIAAAVLGGYLVETVGVRWNFRVNSVTFLLSAAFLFLIRPPKTHGLESVGFSALLDGFRYVARHRRVIELIVVAGILWTGAAVVRSIIPAVVKDVFHGGYGEIGLYQGLLGVGLLSGSITLTLIGPALRSELAISWSLKFAGLSGLLMTVAVGLGWRASICAAAIVTIGFFGAGILVSVNALLQRIVPNYIRGRVFGVKDLATMGGLLLATGLLGIPQWPHIDRHIVWIMALTSTLLFSAGLWTTYVRLGRSRFGRAIMFWRNVNEFYCRIWPRVRREGICTVPLEGPVIVAANHHSTLDPFLLTATSPNRYVSFMIAREFAEIPGFSRLVQMIECVPVSRSRIDTASVRAALRHLASGRAVGIFPQGRVQHPDEPPELREGVGLLALRSGATVIPAYISNTRYSPSVIVPFLRRHRAVVRYGKPVDLSRWQGREKDREAYREASEEILRAIFALRPPSEPEQVRA